MPLKCHKLNISNCTSEMNHSKKKLASNNYIKSKTKILNRVRLEAKTKSANLVKENV